MPETGGGGRQGQEDQKVKLSYKFQDSLEYIRFSKQASRQTKNPKTQHVSYENQKTKVR